MLKVKVKASQITNLTDARYFAAWEVEWLGFNFDKGSENYIQPQVMKAIKEWVDGVQFVGEFSFSSAEEIQGAVDILELDAVQVGMFTEVEVLQQLKNISIIKEVVVTKEMDEIFLEKHFQENARHVNALLLNFDKNGITWEMLKNKTSKISSEWVKKMVEKYPIILSIDLTGNALEEILELSDLEGINVVGGEEEKVGLKSFDELDEIFEALEVLV